MRQAITTNPILRRLSVALYRLVQRGRFSGSADYWETRYAAGGSSGAGSVGESARFKADTLNRFVAEHSVQTVIEFGCGDGSQLQLAEYPAYLGLDIAASAVERCRSLFASDPAKHFEVYPPEAYEAAQCLHRAELALSLDVIYHLVEDSVYERYLRHLFSAAERFVIVYSTNIDAAAAPPTALHVRHRQFSGWVADRCPGWELVSVISPQGANPPDRAISLEPVFFIYHKMGSAGPLSA